MIPISLGALLPLVLLLGALCVRLRARNRRLRKRLDRYRRVARGSEEWPIPTVELAAVDPAFAPGEFGYTPAAEVHFVGTGGRGVVAGTTDEEAWILSVLAKRAHRIFEFGTCTGRTTYLLARNSPPDARVTSLTLAPEQRAEYADEASDEPAARRHALEESCFTRFYYGGTSVESKIEQLFGDSKRFDESGHEERCDLVFVDGSHAYSYVRSDSEKALRMLRPGGVALWHDYRGPDVPKTLGVFQALNELAERLRLVRLEGSSLVAYRRPAATEPPQ